MKTRHRRNKCSRKGMEGMKAGEPESTDATNPFPDATQAERILGGVVMHQRQMWARVSRKNPIQRMFWSNGEKDLHQNSKCGNEKGGSFKKGQQKKLGCLPRTWRPVTAAQTLTASGLERVRASRITVGGLPESRPKRASALFVLTILPRAG